MNSIIQPRYGAIAYGAPAKARGTRQSGALSGSSPDMAARTGERAGDSLEITGTESAQQKPELSEAEEMQLFKKEFYEDLSKITTHPSVSNAAVNISDEAFQAMKDDPEYRAQVLSLLQRDLGGAYVPGNCSVLLTVGTSLDQYRGDSWSVGNDSEFHMRSKDSFFKKTSGGKNQQKKLLDEYQEKKLQAKRRQQRLLDKAARDRRRLAQIGVEEKPFPSIADLLQTRITGPSSSAPGASLPAGTNLPFSNL